MKEIQAIVHRLNAGAGRTVLATLVTVEGSSYRRPGARLLVLSRGERIGSISGGCLEEDVMARAAAVARNGLPDVALYDTASENDQVWGVGLGCHGIVRILIEPLPDRPGWAAAIDESLRAGKAREIGVRWQGGSLGTRLAEEFAAGAPADGVYWQTVEPPNALFVFGAGDDAQPLVKLADSLGWSVTVADPRPAYATEPRFPAARRVVSQPADRLVAAADPPEGAIAVVMSHHYVHDVPVLRDLLGRRLSYVGLLGPRRRGRRLLQDIRAAGTLFAADALERLHSPAGLDLGSDGPDEVALSIVAEIRAVLAGRSGRPLRERKAPIHE
ncbi:MAG: XdhC family protein [Opitutaceae bacterium]